MPEPEVFLNMVVQHSNFLLGVQANGCVSLNSYSIKSDVSHMEMFTLCDQLGYGGGPMKSHKPFICRQNALSILFVFQLLYLSIFNLFMLLNCCICYFSGTSLLNAVISLSITQLDRRCIGI